MRAFLCVWVCWGCGDGRAADADADTDADTDADSDSDTGTGGGDACGFGEVGVATIDVAEIAATYSQIGALVRSGPDPSFHVVSQEEGACRHLEARTGFCDPACAAGEACNADDVCFPYPELVSGGTLTIEGLGDPIEIEPEDWSPGTYVGPWDLPVDLFDESDVVLARLAGDTFPAVSLEAKGVAPIDGEIRDTGFEMRGGADAQVTWTPGPDPDACIRFVLNGPNRRHGAPLDHVIECEGPDTGSLVVPQAIVEAFPIGETPEITEGFDWPQSELTRYARDRGATASGAATLVVRSTIIFRYRHPE